MTTIRALVLGLLSCLCVSAGAQGAPPPDANDPTLESIAQKVAEIKASPLTEEQQSALLAVYQQAGDQLRAADEVARQAATFEEDGRQAPEQVKTLQAELVLPREDPRIDVPDSRDLPVLESRLTDAIAELATAREALAALEAEPARRKGRRGEVSEQRIALQKQLDELRLALDVAAPEGESPEMTLARRTAAQAQKRTIEARLDALAREVASYDARGNLLPLKRQKKQRLVTLLEKRQELWQEAVNSARQQIAEESLREARRASLAKMHPVLKEIAERNIALAEEQAHGLDRNPISRRRGEIEARLTAVRAERDEIRKDLNIFSIRGTSIDLFEGSARALMRERSELPDMRSLNAELRELGPETLRYQRREIELEDEILLLGRIDARVDELLARVQPPLEEAAMDSLAAQARALYQQQLDYLTQLKGDYGNLLDRTSELGAYMRDLVAVSREFADFISERLVWIRSDPPLEQADLMRAVEGLTRFISPRRWAALTNELSADAIAHPIRTAGWLAFLIAAFLVRMPLKRRMRILHERSANWRTDTIGLTFKCLAMLIVIAAGPALILWVVSWHISTLPILPDIGDMVAVGLLKTATVCFGLEFLRRLIRPNGICEIHFHWPRNSLRLLSRHMKWLIPTALPLVFLFACMQRQGLDLRSMTLARVLLGLITLMISMFLAFILRPTGSIATEFWGKAKDSWAYRVRHVWYCLIVAAPLLLSALATVGYSYTALELLEGIWNSTILVFGLTLFRAITLRSLILARRRLALEQARKRQEASDSAQAKGVPQIAVMEVTPGSEPALDLSTIDQQTRTLIKTAVAVTLAVGLWLIWKDLMPALRYFDQIHLWQIEMPIESLPIESPLSLLANGDAAAASEATPAVNAAPQIGLRWITLANVLASILLVTVTVIAARDIPGLLEIAFLQRLPLSPGARFAAVTLARYALVSIGMVMAFNKLGLSWSSIGWLVAALSVGLGFGLQEIVANFVSGIIILFERPVRVGDVVTIGDVEGTVTRIRIRATTLLNWDRKEQLVPNKEFITGRLTNWTLSDDVIRLVVPVGVAYDSNLEHVKEVLLRIAQENPHILAVPQTSALLRSFDASSILFELRVFLKSPDEIPVARHELHDAIHREFERHGIVIAFPQTDIHVKAIDNDTLRRQSGDPDLNSTVTG